MKLGHRRRSLSALPAPSAAGSLLALVAPYLRTMDDETRRALRKGAGD